MAFIFVTGRLGKDAEIETTSGGTKVVKFKVVENEYKNGEESSTWYDCASFNPFIIDKQIKALKKGSLVTVGGNLTVKPSFGNNGQLYLNYNVITNDIKVINTTKRDGNQNASSGEESATNTSSEEVPTMSMPKQKPTEKPVEAEPKATSEPAPYVDESDDEELPF